MHGHACTRVSQEVKERIPPRFGGLDKLPPIIIEMYRDPLNRLVTFISCGKTWRVYNREREKEGGRMRRWSINNKE